MKKKKVIKSKRTKKSPRKVRRKNPVYITDPNALDLMTQIEGDWWKEQQLFKKKENQPDYTGFYGNLKMYLELLRQLKQEKDEEYRKHMKEIYSQTIYGAGGNHRYFVRGDGRIIFSKRHTLSDEKIKLAKSLGFDVE